MSCERKEDNPWQPTEDEIEKFETMMRQFIQEWRGGVYFLIACYLQKLQEKYRGLPLNDLTPEKRGRYLMELILFNLDEFKIHIKVFCNGTLILTIKNT